MAQVTFGTPAVQRHVIGDLVLEAYVINGPTGSTLTPTVKNVIWIDIQQSPQGGGASVITSYVLSAGVVTFTTSGTMVNEVVLIIGRVG